MISLAGAFDWSGKKHRLGTVTRQVVILHLILRIPERRPGERRQTEELVPDQLSNYQSLPTLDRENWRLELAGCSCRAMNISVLPQSKEGISHSSYKDNRFHTGEATFMWTHSSGGKGRGLRAARQPGVKCQR